MSTKQEEPIILPDSPIAAERVTVTGWRSRHGHFFGDNEHLARWDGSTHRPCAECGTPVSKHSFAKCDKCRVLADWKRYDAAATQVWDGSSMVYADALDVYFNDRADYDDYQELREYDGEKPLTPREMRLYICTPQYAASCELDAEFFDEMLPGDAEAPDEVQDAIDEFNAKMRAYTKPLSYYPSNVAAVLETVPECTCKFEENMSVDLDCPKHGKENVDWKP